LKGMVYEGVLRLNRLMARQYITVTETLQAKAAAQGDGARSTLIHNAVPVPENPPTAKDPAMRADWGFAPGDFVAAIVARLKPVKGHQYLIDAMAQLGDLPHVKLLIVGDGPLRADLEKQAVAAGVADRVCFAGFRQDIPRVLPSVDALCMASLSEALPYAILEGASHARPILATAVGGMATLLEDRQTALLVPPQDSGALAGGLRWLATHPDEARAIGRAAYDLVRRSFSVEAMIKKTLQVYDRAIS
jgi:glycosyltransferase involved in cell wall biosynthesis